MADETEEPTVIPFNKMTPRDKLRATHPSPALNEQEEELAKVLFNIERCGDAFSVGTHASPLMKQLAFNLCRNEVNAAVVIAMLHKATYGDDGEMGTIS